MAVYRVYKNTNYTVMSNHHLRDKDLSLRAKGMLSVMLMLPDDWKYSISGLAAIVKEGASSVRSAVSELRDAGYVRVTKARDDGGKIRFQYDVFEIPMEGDEAPQVEPCVADAQMEIPGLDDVCDDAPAASGSEKPQVETSEEKPHTVEPHTVSRALLNTKDKVLTNKGKKGRKRRAGATTFDAIIAERTDNPELASALGEFIRMRSRIKKPLTDYALRLRLDKLWRLGSTDEERIEIVNQSIGACWQDFFPLRDDGGKANGGSRNAEYDTV